MSRSALTPFLYVPCLSLALLISGCGGGGGGDSASSAGTIAASTKVAKADGVQSAAVTAPVALRPVDVGSFLFKDVNLSASGKMACATCHAEGFGRADAPGVKLPLGGANLDLSGMRSSPTVRCAT